jgi:hypothetical protein
MNSLRTLEQVEADVRTLSPQEQAQLRALLEDLLEDRLELTDSFLPEAEADAERAWDVELERRGQQIRSGRATGEPAEKVFSELRAKYS